jgi:hypothetical protein
MKTTLFSLFVFVSLILAQSASAQVIPGQTCDTPININCGDVFSESTLGVLNDNATSGAANCITSAGTGGQYWYAFTETSEHLVSAFTCGSGTNYDTKIQVFTGTCGALTCVSGNDDGCQSLASSVTFTTQANTTYLIRVGGFASQVGTFSFSLVCSDYAGGCMNPEASNYDETATYDDGSCLYEGCTDPSALNYDPIANTDNGSCEYCSGEGSVIAQLYVCAYSAGYEMNLDIIDENGVVVYNVSNLADNQIFYADLCLSAGQCYTVNMTNAAGNAGWNNGYFWINTNNMQLINQSLNQNLTMESTIFSIDGTCTAISGCTDPEASNYNPAANADDGSCFYSVVCENGTTVDLNMVTGGFPSECSFTIIDAQSNVVYASSGYFESNSFYSTICLSDGCYTVIMLDSFGDGWNGGYLNVYFGGTVTQFSIQNGSSGAGVFAINAEGCLPNISSGCMNPLADNYDPTAIFDDGSCVISGCTDMNAMNYNGNATVDNGSCEYCNGEGSSMAQLYICTFSNGQQVGLQITDDQGNNVYTAGTLASGAIVYETLCLQAGVCYTATMSNNTGPFGWYGGYFWVNAANVQIINAQPGATDEVATVQFSIDGTCGPVLGCTDPNALNYNPEATTNDGSCQYPIYGCTDPLALNYNYYATIDDGSCYYAQECNENMIVFQFYPGTFVSEGSFDVMDANGSVVFYYNGQTTGMVCLPDGCYTLNMYDTFGDGWDGGGYLDVFMNDVYYGQFTLEFGLSFGSIGFGINAEGCAAAVNGCTDPSALNFNPMATQDDGSCVYPENCDANLVTISIVTQTWGSEISWDLIAEDGTIAASGAGYSSWNYYTQTLCLPDGCYSLQLNDSWGDGWNGGYYMISSANNYFEGSLFYGATNTDLISVNASCGDMPGCMDPEALNYNPAATMDDGSCFYNDSNPEFNFNVSNGLELEYNIYPNPTNGEIVIDLNNLDYASNINVNVRSLDGKLVATQFVSNTESFRRFNMNLADLSAGYYFVQVVNGINVETLPLIKQ